MDKEKLKLIKYQIEECNKCKERIGDSNLSKKNYPFKKSLDFIPEETKIMFVAEEPPENGNYFYELSDKDSVRSRLLALLKNSGIFYFQMRDLIFSDRSRNVIKDFAKNGFYLADIVKCPKGDVKNCFEFLKQEIDILNPKIICTLGSKATKTFIKEKNIKFEEILKDKLSLQKNIIIDDFNSYKIFPCHFPTTAPVTNKERVERFKILKSFIENGLN